MSSASFVTRTHSLGINAFHLEWCPKYRYKVLTGSIIKPILERSLLGTAKAYGMQVFALEISADHVHMFVNLPATLSVAAALQLFKGRSSKEIFAACKSFRGVYHKGHFWSRGSFYRSVSNVAADTIYNYITAHRSKELSVSVSSVQSEFGQLNLVSFLGENRTL